MIGPSGDKQTLIKAGSIVAGAVFVLFYSWSAMRTAGNGRSVAEENLAETRRLTRQISALQNRPRVASLEAESPARITRRITRAATEANVKLQSVISLDPQSPSRLGRSEYQLRATQIEVRDVSLKQLIRFSVILSDQDQGLLVRDITLASRQSRFGSPARRLSAPGSERWDARLTLTQLIYSPISES